MNTNINKRIVRQNMGRAVETDDLVSIATLAALEADKTYRPDMGAKPDTWQWAQVAGHVKTAICKETCWKYNRTDLVRTDTEEEVEIELPAEDTRYAGFEFISSLSSDCRKIADIVMGDPGAYVGMLPKFARGAVVQKLREQGWSWSRIWAAMAQMKNEVMS